MTYRFADAKFVLGPLASPDPETPTETTLATQHVRGAHEQSPSSAASFEFGNAGQFSCFLFSSSFSLFFSRPPIAPRHDQLIKIQDTALHTMKLQLFTTWLCAITSCAGAGIVITPIKDNQIVEKASGDCFFGVVTPQGCG